MRNSLYLEAEEVMDGQCITADAWNTNKRHTTTNNLAVIEPLVAALP